METQKIYSRDKLRNMMDQNESEVDELMKIFIEMAPSLLKEMLDFADNEDWKSCSELAHKLKSSMRLWAIDSLDEDVLFIETHGLLSENTDMVLSKIQNLNHKLLQVIEQMKSEIEENKS